MGTVWWLQEQERRGFAVVVIDMATLAEILTSTQLQQIHNTHITFLASLNNSYRKKSPPKSNVKHLGRGNILRGSIASYCHHAVAQFPVNPLMISWEIVTTDEIAKNPSSYCSRCVEVILVGQ